MHTEIITIWPNGDAPGASDSRAQPQIVDLAKEYEPYDRAATGVRCLEIALWHPEESNGITLLVAPGSGYQRVLIDREGSALATFFTAMGYTLAVMTYRLPYDGHHEGADAPLADTQRAVRVLRERTQRGLNGKYIVNGLFRRWPCRRQPGHALCRENLPGTGWRGEFLATSRRDGAGLSGDQHARRHRA
nr:pectin acetylesterase [Candidatus Pantoea persica]